MSSTDVRRRRRPLRAAAPAAAALLLTACADAPPAGYGGPGDADFGRAVRSNVAVHVGEVSDAQFADLVAAFRAAAPDRVGFAFDSDALDAEAARALDAQARWLRLNAQALVRVEGHADLAGGERYNDGLGLRRAQAVATRLAELGVNPARLATLQSFGERRPEVPVEGPEPRNRRVVVALEGWGDPIPGRGFDGKRALLAYTRYAQDEVEEPQSQTVGGAGGGDG